MILDAHSGLRGVLVNADTGQRIALAVWADTETGEYEAFRTADGRTPLKDEAGRPIKYRGRANLRFVASSAPSLPSVSVAAPPGVVGQDARPARFSPLVFPASLDLADVERLCQSPRKLVAMRAGMLRDALLGIGTNDDRSGQEQKVRVCLTLLQDALASDGRPFVGKHKMCDAKGCYRLAQWETRDEQQIESETGPDGRLYERSLGFLWHYWCSWHYRFPLATSVRGVTNEVEVTARPQ